MSTEGCIEGRVACREEAGKSLCHWRWRSDAGPDKEIFVWVGHAQKSGVKGSLPVCKGYNAYSYGDRQYPRELDHIHRDTVFSRLSPDTTWVSKSLCLIVASIALYSSVGETRAGDWELETLAQDSGACGAGGPLGLALAHRLSSLPIAHSAFTLSMH